MLFLAQAIGRGMAIIEHPDQPGERGMHRPASIWILTITQFIKSTSTVFPLHIKQGDWNAYSPKPTLLLVTVPGTTGAAILKCLEGFRVRPDLLPPLIMGKSTYNVYTVCARVWQQQPCLRARWSTPMPTRPGPGGCKVAQGDLQQLRWQEASTVPSSSWSPPDAQRCFRSASILYHLTSTATLLGPKQQR